jgi:hypothetical protein
MGLPSSARETEQIDLSIDLDGLEASERYLKFSKGLRGKADIRKEPLL